MLNYYFFLKLERRLPTKLLVLVTVFLLIGSGDSFPGNTIPVAASYTISMLVECHEEHSM